MGLINRLPRLIGCGIPFLIEEEFKQGGLYLNKIIFFVMELQMSVQYSDVTNVINNETSFVIKKIDDAQNSAQTFLQKTNYSSEYRQECDVYISQIAQEKELIEKSKNKKIFPKLKN
ncbi:MAG: hypothetical protein EBQ95_03920 [Gammaproteobacteria bacterium]|nr:hypothetical protein [Gammaproteobacteria bacterium]